MSLLLEELVSLENQLEKTLESVRAITIKASRTGGFKFLGS